MKFMTLRVGVSLAVVSCLVGALAGQADARPRDTAIVDSLNASPSTTFAVSGGAAGLSVFPSQYVGPRFVLTRRTLITEVGAFFQADPLSPFDPAPSPIAVEIRPETDGAPDLTRVIASARLSDDGTTQFISYESARFHRSLPPGAYYALFVPVGSGSGYVLTNAVLPSGEPYTPGPTDVGVVQPGLGARLDHQVPLATRVLGRHRR